MSEEVQTAVKTTEAIAGLMGQKVGVSVVNRNKNKKVWLNFLEMGGTPLIAGWFIREKTV